ncbi:hypothetical protein [Sphingomonas sp.]
MKLATPGKPGFDGSRPAAIDRFPAEHCLGNGTLGYRGHCPINYTARTVSELPAPRPHSFRNQEQHP